MIAGRWNWRPSGTVLRATAVVAVGIIGLVQQLRIQAQLTGRYVSEDQALMWAAARAWGHAQPHDPSFWGQRYGVTFEAIPAELLRWFGVHLDVGFAFVILMMGLAGWWLMAAAAWWRGHQAFALGLVAAPVLLRTNYSVVVDTYASGLGRLLAAATVAAAIAWPRRAAGWTLTVALGGLAVLFDQSTAIVVVPVAIWLVALLWGRWKTLAYGALGALVPLTWFVFTRLYMAAHPDRDLHPPPALRPSWKILHGNLTHLNRQLGLVAPQLAPRGWVAVVCVLVAGGVLLLLRAYWAAVALAVGVAGTVLILALPKSLDGMSTIYFQAGRVVLCLPMLLALAAFMAVEHGMRPRWPVMGVVGVVVGVSVLVQVFTLSTHLDHLESEALAAKGYPLTTVSAMNQRCNQVQQVASVAHSQWAVFTGDRTQAYACAALADGALDTLFPVYERRTWLLDKAASTPATSLVLWGVSPDLCGAWTKVVSTCRQVASDGLLVEFASQPPLDVIHAMGFEIRPFGPDCHPRQPSSCEWFNQRYGPQAPSESNSGSAASGSMP